MNKSKSSGCLEKKIKQGQRKAWRILSPKNLTKFGQNPLKDVDSRVFTRITDIWNKYPRDNNPQKQQKSYRDHP
jgi:hypothetical protein